jgi:hypothetical protein
MRRTIMLVQRFSLIAFLAIAGFCFGQTSPTPTATAPFSPFAEKTGIDGRIKMSPSHPGPERPGMQNSSPLANAIFVLTDKSGATTEFTTDEQGHFKISLAPGHYTASRKGGNTKIGHCGPFDAFVVAGQMTHVEWTCDSGMR